MRTRSRKRRLRPVVLGVTGGIGAGKSTVCDLFRSAGRTVLSADKVGSGISEKNRTIVRKIKSEFGDQLYARGKLDRSALASIVFRDPAALSRLNAIIHPTVIRLLDRSLRSLPPQHRDPFVVVESALIFEANLLDFFDYILVVDAPLEERVRRQARRTGLSKAEIRRRARAQLPGGWKRRQADFVILNRGSRRDLSKKVRFIDRLLAEMCEKG